MWSTIFAPTSVRFSYFWGQVTPEQRSSWNCIFLWFSNEYISSAVPEKKPLRNTRQACPTFFPFLPAAFWSWDQWEKNNVGSVHCLNISSIKTLWAITFYLGYDKISLLLLLLQQTGNQEVKIAMNIIYMWYIREKLEINPLVAPFYSAPLINYIVCST